MLSKKQTNKNPVWPSAWLTFPHEFWMSCSSNQKPNYFYVETQAGKNVILETIIFNTGVEGKLVMCIIFL